MSNYSSDLLATDVANILGITRQGAEIRLYFKLRDGLLPPAHKKRWPREQLIKAGILPEPTAHSA